jgi:acetylornithine deacetylase/succinyl-diaminopimelate desuccinylase-like protein
VSSRHEGYLAGARDRHLAELDAFLRIPSISTLPEYAPELGRCAEFVAGQFEAIGLRGVERLETGGNPIVYGEWLDAGPQAPTLLLYGHYDVQPADPLELWLTPPFEPSFRDGRVFARGATDNKGPLFVYLKALEALIAVDGRLGCNVKLLVEGEEELRADHLEAFMQDRRALLRCDALVISDSAQYGAGIPSIPLSLRGMAALQLRLETATSDLHSGSYGGVAPNALDALVRLLATLRDERGVVTVEGFDHDVVPTDPRELEEWRKLPFDPEQLREQIGAKLLIGDDGQHGVLERMWTRPTLDLHGIWGGFSGEGIKTVIPAEAHAKLSCRLVPDQEPEQVLALVIAHLERHCPPEASLTIEWTLPGATPIEMASDHPLVEAAADALAATYGRDPIYFRSGWSVPVAEIAKRRLGVDSLLLGFGLPGDGAHAPNEHFALESFDLGTRTMVEFLSRCAERRYRAGGDTGDEVSGPG